MMVMTMLRRSMMGVMANMMLVIKLLERQDMMMMVVMLMLIVEYLFVCQGMVVIKGG